MRGTRFFCIYKLLVFKVLGKIARGERGISLRRVRKNYRDKRAKAYKKTDGLLSPSVFMDDYSAILRS